MIADISLQREARDLWDSARAAKRAESQNRKLAREKLRKLAELRARCKEYGIDLDLGPDFDPQRLVAKNQKGSQPHDERHTLH